MDCRYFIHPSTILISGPTGSGKTRFVQRLITNKMSHHGQLKLNEFMENGKEPMRNY